MSTKPHRQVRICIEFVINHNLFRLRSIKRSEEHTSELQSQSNLVCRLLLEKKNILTTAVRAAGVSNTARTTLSGSLLLVSSAPFMLPHPSPHVVHMSPALVEPALVHAAMRS